MDNIDGTWECVNLKRISPSKKARSEILPDGVDCLKADDLPLIENNICDRWVSYMDDLKSKRFALVNHKEKAVKVNWLSGRVGIM